MKILIKTDNESKHMREKALACAVLLEKKKDGIHSGFRFDLDQPDGFYHFDVTESYNLITVSVTKQNSTF